MTTRKYSSRSQQTTLSAALTSSATTTTVVSGSALLGGITISAGELFTVVIDPDTALEEIVDISAVSTNTLTIVRGIDGSSAVAHSAGAIVRHMAIGRDYREANTHIEATTGHGATGAVVGTTNTQTLTNKTLTSPTITGTGAIAGTFTGNLTGNVTGTVSGNAGTVTNGVYTTDTGTVTSTMIANGTIVNADINASAAIDKTKINGTAVTVADTGTVTSTMILDGTILDADINSAAAIDKTKINGTAITAGDTGTVTSTMIANDTIVNADINTSAQIAYSKINATNSIVDADINASAAITKTKISGTAITAADTGTVTSTMIADGTIVNADINASAAIDKTKISGTAVTVADTGTVTSTMILDGTILNADINASAAIDWTKIAPSSTVSVTELGYLDGVTSAVQTQIDSKLATATAASTYAPLASPALTGVPTAPTAAANTNTTQIATTAYVQTEIADLIAAAPGALDTLDELAAALGDDAAFSTTVTNSIATKLPLAGGTMSGAIAMGTNKITGLGTPTATGDAATKDYADTKLALTGGTLSGALAMGTNKITGLGTPTVSTDASTKAYVDTMLPLAGGTMTGAIAMGTNKITGVGDPTNAQDVATKNYIDTAVLAPSNLTGPITSSGAATSIASQTGTGTKFVMDNTPTLITPVLGVATATSINGTTIPSSKTLVATDSTTYVVPSQAGNSGKYLTTDGTASSWGTVAGYSAPTLGTTSIASGSTNTSVTGLTLADGNIKNTPSGFAATNNSGIWFSADGGFWNKAFDGSFFSVAFGGGKWVALPINGSIARYSTDGITWDFASLPASKNWATIAYGNGRFVATSNESNAYTAYSTDGITWTAGGAAGASNGGSNSQLTYGANGFLLSKTPGYGALSTDAVTWTAVTLPASAVDYISSAYGAGKYVVITGGTFTNTDVFAYSSNGTSWTAGTLPTSAKWTSVTFAAGKFVAVSKFSDTAAYSTDGVNWTAATLPSNSDWISVTYGNGKFFAITASSMATAASTDGITWTAGTLPANTTYNQVAFGISTAAPVVGNPGQVLTSNGEDVSWTTIVLPTAYDAPTIGGTLISSGSTNSSFDSLTLTTPTLENATINYPTFKSPTETANVVASAATGTVNINVSTSTIWYYTTNATANHTLNFRYDAFTSLSSKLSVGEAITIVWITPNGATAYYPNVIQIDGTTVTPKIQGGTAITGGNASATDIYSFTIIKTAATPTYLVLESQTKFA